MSYLVVCEPSYLDTFGQVSRPYGDRTSPSNDALTQTISAS